ncbi:GntR family transcriptional regulator [Nonomuraea solani]|uniref:GntR family transcriptional regulator n=1 Tax=Nonomuraea solani TaxID=1144553 RepID=A0A1H5UXI1_9ACTN|nr:GntR family transcriptional regulator [Nonomuraea solani]SEF79151.1 GntR family transcriptional regulator [Nonomuraea solani]
MPTSSGGKPRPHLTGSQGGEPKYQAIYRHLLAQIDGGELEPGQPLPSQRELGTYYGVSLMTVRQALQRLSTEGRIEQRHGLGTFVAGTVIPYGLNSLGSLAEGLAGQGIDLETVLLGVRRAPAPGWVAAELRLAPDTEVTVVERLRKVDGSPVIHQLSYIPPGPAAELSGDELGRVPLYRLIEERGGGSPEWATEAIKPVVLSEAQAALLHRAAGGAALMSTRVTYDATDRPLLADLALMCASHLAFTTKRHASEPAVSLRLDH